jgi:hypothetical protein|tara:strand:- start:77 stop:211 length:135 start_codon:yes stop_codon:yes gene_type:complete
MMEIIAISTLGIITLVSLVGNIYLVIQVIKSTRKEKVKTKKNRR